MKSNLPLKSASALYTKKLPLLLMLFAFLSGWGQGNETFTNIPTTAPGNYNARSWTGDNGVIWTATSARTDQTLTGKAICTNNNGTVSSPSYAGGMGTLTFNYVRGFTGTGARSLTVWVNGTQVGGTFIVNPTSNVVQNYSTAINVSGVVSAEIRTTGAQIIIDDISWNAYSPCTPAPDPVGTISGTTPSCTSTILTYAGADSATAYWQTSATGTSSSEPATATKTVSTSGTYYVRIYNGTCWSTGNVNKAIVINAPINITTQPANASVVAGSNTSFTVAASNVAGYQWQVDTGAGYSNLSNGAPYANVTTATLNITAATISMTGYQYRCVMTANSPCSNTSTNGLATLTVTNASPNNATALKACIANTQITLSWTASSGTAPTGYLVFAQPNTTIPQMAAATAGNASNYTANTDYSAATVYTTLGKAVFKGNATTATITGLTNLSQYTFKVVAYNGETGTGWSSGINGSGSWNQTYTIDVPEVTNLAASIASTTSTVTWNVIPNSTGCYEYLVVANGGAVTFTPTGDGSAYSANTVYSGVNQVVYKGTGNSVIVTGLTNGIQYCYKVFVRELNSTNQWSDGIAVCATPNIAYCTASGNTTYQTGITNVQFNTINQSSGKTTGYSDYTAVSTPVTLGSYYPLSVKANTDGNFTVYSKVWFDWNHDGTFSASEEEDLGTAINVANGVTSNSPLPILIPHNAAVGNTRMRVSVKYNTYATPCESAFDGEVEDYTLNIIQPVTAEMNVKGGASSIPNGFDNPNGLNNTLFGSTPINTDSAEKTFTIENVGLADLNLSGATKINIVGTNPTDFIVTLQSASPVLGGSTATFKIKFHPVASGLRTATVSIDNNDPDENPYTFAIEGTGTCTAIPVLSVFPISGPAKTVVDFTSATSDLTRATVTYNEVLLPVISSSPTTLQVQVPANANDGIFVVQLQTGCKFTQDFDVFDGDLTSCEESVSANASDLIIYEVYDENGGSGGIVTIFNGTGAAVDLSSYNIQRAPDYGGTYSVYANLTGTLANGTLAIVGVSGSSCPYTPTGNGSFGATGFNGNDGIRLRKGTTVIDDFKAPNYFGYYLRRKPGNLSPSPAFIAVQWTNQSISSGQCLPNVGNAPSVKAPPVLLSSPVYTPSCSEVTLTVSGQEGFVGGNALTFQWFALAPMSNNWISISDGPIYSGSTTANLTISDLIATDGYQFYAQVRESTATCYIASNATKVELQKTTWAGSWSNGLPTVNSNVIIAGSYNTAINGALDICRITLNSPGNLLIKNGFPVKVKNKVTNNSSSDHFVIESGGNLIQEDVVTNSGAIIAERSIFDLDNDPAIKMDYVFWSSPVTPQNIQQFSPGTPANRLFEYKESTDKFIATTDADFKVGKGYAIRAESGNVTPTTYSKVYEFNGVPNNGDYTQTLIRSNNQGGIEHGYNLVGNPYPSNLSFDELYNLNSTIIYKTAWFWTNTTYTQSQQGSSYNGNNYAVYNATGGNAATVPANVTYNAIIPDGKIAVGQGFLIQLRNIGSNQTLTFKNKNGANFLRVGTAADFYQKNNETKDRFWLKLIAPNNMQNTQLIGYVTGSTNGYERDYDAKAISDTSSNLFYSTIDQEKLIIQGRGEFKVEDKIKLGANIFVGGNYTIGLYKSEGIFTNSQHIYLKDNVLNSITDLSVKDYNFYSESGDNNSRFDIIFKPELTLITSDNTKDHLQVYRNGEQFIVRSNAGKIEQVEVYDVSGRLLEKVEGGRTQLNVDATGLANGIYVLKIKTGNAVISKKIMK